MPDDKRIAVLTSRLKRLGGYILGKKLLYGFLVLISLFLAAVFLAGVSHWLFYLPTWYRTAFVLASAVLALGIFVWFILRPMFRKPSVEDLALLVEKKYPHLQNRMIASLQLERNLLTNKENYSVALIRQCIEQAEELSETIKFNESYRTKHLSNGLKYLGTTGLLTVALWLLLPGIFSSSIDVFSHPMRVIPKELTYNLEVSPKSADVLKFDNLKVDAVVFGSRLPEHARVFWRVADDWRSEEVTKADKIEELPEIDSGLIAASPDTSLFSYDFKEIRHDFQYYVQAGDVRSAIYDVKVVDKPRINNLKLTYFYPKYTGLAPVVVDENDGTIQALKGTNVKIEAELNKQVAEGKLVFDDGKSKEIDLNGTKAEATLRVMQNGTYHIEVADNMGHKNPDPIEYKIYMLEDNYPQVSVVKPGANIDLDDYMAFDVSAALSDDYGFSRLVLHYVVHFSPMQAEGDSIEFKFDKKKTNQVIQFYWDLSNKGMYPGSFVEYYFEVWDNDNVTGPKSAVSRTFIARQPTLEEMFSDIEESRKDMISEMSEALQRELQVQEQAKKLHEDLQFQEDLKWETQQDIKKLQDTQENLMQNLEKMAEQFDQINQQAKEKDMLSLEMIQKLNELQKLFDEVATPEMKEAMKKLQDAIEQMDKDELEKAMKDFDMSTEDMIKNLDRALAQLKKFQAEQKMQAMIAMAEKILENQNNVNDKTEDSKDSDLPNLKDQEDRNADDMQALKDEVPELRQLLKESNLSDDPNGGQFCESVEKSDADADMEEMSSNLQQKKKQNAKKSGNSASEKLEALIGKMKDSQSAMSNQMSAEAAQKMREAVDDLLYLSDEQEALYNEILPLSPKSQLLPEFAQKQQDLKSEAERIRAELQEAAKQSIFIKNALDKYMQGACESMGSSISALTGLNGRSAASHQSEGIYSLNQSAQTLIQSLNSQSQCNSSCSNNQSMFDKMNSLSKGQKKVNKQTQSSCNNPSENPGKPSPEALRRLAAQQQQIRNGVGEVIDQFGDRKDVAGRLDKLQEEMKKVIESLESGNVGSETLERQKNIYSRMLDFQLSLEQRDYSEKRRADTGEDVVRKSPAELDLEKRLQESAYRAKLEKFMEESYPPEYESLIRDYYKALMNNQQQVNE